MLQAGKLLREHPLGDIALPEDILSILAALPHPGLIKEVSLFDRPNYRNLYKAVQYEKADFEAAADVGKEGNMTLFQADRNILMVDYFFHEWSHLTRWASPELARFFDMATLVDKVSSNHDYKATNSSRIHDPQHPDVFKDGI